ncbi:hypothetical protein O181_032890 [Austropuccinia psidii MF-1]|uniref:Uncharacterized protein n=1 Tax=Austropuccinia psidii MF-1 TaxID=1389203 RepID=A0A9Q3D1Y6_9BASI|nr:hypothetical protein [Austropuccinia psidii MF-1]
MEIDRKKKFKFSEWATKRGAPDSGNTDSEGTESVEDICKNKQCGILLQLLQQKDGSPELESKLEEPWLRDCKANKCFIIDGLLYHREKHTGALKIIDRDNISLILQECHDPPYLGHMSEDRTKERVESTAL